MTGTAADPAIIELAGVEKTYGAGGRGGGRGVGFGALNGVDLAIAKREMVAITGPSGSGKTTIINLIVLAGVLALTLVVIRGPLRRATRIQPGTALRCQ